MVLLTDRYAKKISGALSCFDRVVIKGTLPHFLLRRRLTGFLYLNKIKMFDYPRFAEPLRDELRKNAERTPKENGLEIEFIRKKNFRNENSVRDILSARGAQPGLVDIFSAMEPCQTYRPWHNKQTNRTYLRPDDGKCFHYYFYVIDEQL